LLTAAVKELDRSTLEDIYQGKNTGPETSGILKIINLAGSQLRKSFRQVPENEKDVQNVFEVLLIGAGIRYERETVSVTYSSKTYYPDFTVGMLDLAIEMKFCGNTAKEKTLIAEINDDILAYKSKFGNLLFVIYDKGFVRDVDAFCGNFEEQEGVMVRVVKE